MLLTISIIGSILGIALTWLGILANRNGALWSGVVLIFLCGAFTLASLGLYIHSCMVVADLKSFDAVERHNYKTIAQQAQSGINWLGLFEVGIYGRAKTIETFGLTVNEFIEKVRWYNGELGRLRDFNEDIWIDLIFKSPPAELEYILLEEKNKT